MKKIIIISTILVILIVAVVSFVTINSRSQKIKGVSTRISPSPSTSVIYCNTQTPCPTGTVCKFEHGCASKEDPSCNSMVLICEKP